MTLLRNVAASILSDWRHCSCVVDHWMAYQLTDRGSGIQQNYWSEFELFLETVSPSEN
jgi:hypothetical protein